MRQYPPNEDQTMTKKYWKLYRGTTINTAGDIAWLPEFGSYELQDVLGP